MSRSEVTPKSRLRAAMAMGAAAAALAGAALVLSPGYAADGPGSGDWPSYNRTLTSERYVPFDQINRGNVAGLRQLCVYDLGIDTSFQTGPLVIGRTLYGTTEMDTFAIDAATCQQKWRVHEDVHGALPVNRGVAYLDGRLFRGMQDGRVFAYDAATGKKLWEARIADGKRGRIRPCRTDRLERARLHRQCRGRPL